MTTAAQGEPAPPSPLLGPVLRTLPAHLFLHEVLGRLGPTDLASLARAGRGCAAAVAATAIMQWAKRMRVSSPEYILQRLCLQNACAYAASYGNREMLALLHNTGCPWDAETAFAAASGGHLELLQWLHDHGYPWNYMTCAVAARCGHMEVLQWAREHHCPWNSTTPSYAAQTGHLAVI